MHGSYRRVLVAAFIGLTLCGASPPRDSAAREQSQPQQSIADSLRGIDASLKKADEPGEEGRPCSKGEDNRNSDLCAQWKAADSAVESALWTERTFYLGILATILGLFTLGAASAAALFAWKAAKEAKRTADAGDNTLVLEQAPRLSVTVVDGLNVRHRKPFLRKKSALFYKDGNSVAMKIANTGRGEAILHKMYRRWECRKPDVNPPIALHPSGPECGHTHKTRMMIGSEGVTVATYSENAKVGQPTDISYFYGWVEYTDLAEQCRYVTGFCFAYIPAVSARGMTAAWFTADEGNYWFHRQV